MKKIINKLNNSKSLENWTLEEKKQLLEIYYIVSKKESKIFDLIYSYHPCDSWEDIFRDYNINDLRDKKIGVKIAIDGIKEQMKEQ
jgi:hypothetical protein